MNGVGEQKRFLSRVYLKPENLKENPIYIERKKATKNIVLGRMR